MHMAYSNAKENSQLPPLQHMLTRVAHLHMPFVRIIFIWLYFNTR